MKRFLLIALAYTLTSCSHPVEIVGEGDVLSSSGNRDCLLEDFAAELDNCTKNYVIGAYEETYFAVPREGWIFDSWTNYCEDSLVAECSFSMAADIVFEAWGMSVPPLKANFVPVGGGDTISVVGREWLQPALFSDISWNDVNEVCPWPSGICIEGAELQGVDMTGLVWASTEDMTALFNHYIGDPELGPENTTVRATVMLPMLADGWQLTLDAGFLVKAIAGLTRSLHPPNEVDGTSARVLKNRDQPIDSAQIDVIEIRFVPPAFGGGAWFYRRS